MLLVKVRSRSYRKVGNSVYICYFLCQTWFWALESDRIYIFLAYYQHGFAFYCIVRMKCFCLCAELGGTLIMKLNIHSVCFQFWLFPHWSRLYTDLCPSARKLISFHLKPFLQNIVYPEAIGEIQALTDAYDAKRLEADTAAGGLPWEKVAALQNSLFCTYVHISYNLLSFVFHTNSY